MRISIPVNVDDFIVLAKAVQTKHAALGAASPLNGIQGIANLGTLTTTADTQNDTATNLKAQAETAIEARDNALGSDMTTPGYVRYLVASARDVLAGLNKGSEHKLADWGFVVNAAAPASATPKPATPKP